ncbi:MAG: hypothetical protein A3I24_04385 [Candidatus Harrisonbacteria bacterium RIFCSPLOWO2_02_FULL_41_13b]|uniref:Rod shape-determining protein RodA n=1 Tax=Candidatus Harrisonbacteria bacterium RIFCSPLOWO2_02_FULL_41_13b TaxID=1798409 RepID=A0A1G1ZR25_9BACT|nr:MAG: hypothetical protein A3I24_04385 [Candidatus Harrisonbacteria bacterium RIFCSPLOWO2_02_FULL_41_13b]
MLSLIKKQDWLLNLTILFLAISSLLILYSVGSDFFWRQVFWFIVVFIVILSFSLVDWRSLMSYRWLVLLIYLAVVLLLGLTLIFAPTIRSSKSWLVIGPLRFQTAEFAKVALILMLSYFFARRHIAIANWENIFKSFVYFIILAILVLLQPDLGSVLIFSSIWLGFLLVSGIPWRYIFIGLAVFIIISPVAWQYLLKDYQKERVIAVFNTEYSPLKVNYGVNQSKIAIGSAGFWGKGFGQGTQVRLGFLPEAQSDFVFAAFVEEWGFFGGSLIISAFAFLIFRIVKIGLAAENNFARLVCLGVIIMMLAHFTLNVGSAVGLLPVVGVSFPFLSYGGSNLLANAILVGIIQGIMARSSFFRGMPLLMESR